MGKRVTAAVEGHSACAGEIVLVDADLLNGLLGHDIAGCEEYLLPCVGTANQYQWSL